MATLTPAQQQHLVETIMGLGFIDETDRVYLESEVTRHATAALVNLETMHNTARVSIRLNRPGEVLSWNLNPRGRRTEQLASAMADMDTLLEAARACWQLAADMIR